MKHLSDSNFADTNNNIADVSVDVADLLKALNFDQLHNMRRILKTASQSAHLSHGERDTALMALRLVDTTLETY